MYIFYDEGYSNVIVLLQIKTIYFEIRYKHTFYNMLGLFIIAHALAPAHSEV